VIFPAGATRVLRGKIKVHPAGYGFVVPEDKSEDVHVAARNRGAAMDSDTVEIEAWSSVRGTEGRILRVLERGRAKVTGVLAKAGKHVFLHPDDARITGAVDLRGADTIPAHQIGLAVVAEITRYPTTPEGTLEARVVKVLGTPEDPRTEVEKVLAIADVTEEFPEKVERIVEGFGSEVEEKDLHDRADLRHVPFTTIDPETARDFDDAVAMETLPDGGTRLWVAVADVSHYVREGSPVDVEARARGCSIYLPNRAIPMLPEKLSAHLCSLVPEQDRLAMVTRIDYDANLHVRETWFAAAVIHSRARLDYPGVAAALGGDTRGKREKYEPFLPALRAMDAFARRLRVARIARGALDFDLPEAFVELDRDDPALVRDVRKSRRDPAERQAYSMIEEFMLAANEAVATSFTVRQELTLWRIHEPPNRVRMEEFVMLARHYGLHVDIDEARTPKGLRRVLEQLRGHAAEKALSFALLRSLKQATYDVDNVGHFGLASTDYLHFTSPIRRYPDLVVHRRLKQRLARDGQPSGGWRPEERPDADVRAELQGIASSSSFSERQAMEIEREVVDLYRAFFLRDRVGDRFSGTISGVTGFGLFVVVDEPFVEGLVRVEDLPPDSYELDATAAELVGRRGGHTFALGDTLEVEVSSVSVARRRIDFSLPSGAAGRAAVKGRAKMLLRGRSARAARRAQAEEAATPRAGARGRRGDKAQSKGESAKAATPERRTPRAAKKVRGAVKAGKSGKKGLRVRRAAGGTGSGSGRGGRSRSRPGKRR
jgi:ribonuclease R